MFSLAYAIGLEPTEAIRYFQAKGYAITWDWHEMEAAAHARAFTVAKVASLDLLEDIRGALDRALKEGWTKQEFLDRLSPTLQAKGWWGKVESLDANSGEIRQEQLGSPRRLKTIFETNLQTALMAGRYQAMRANVGERPYWQYVAVMDSHTRPAHALLNERVFRWDDPVWDAIWPPNGFNCRCRVRALSEKSLKARGLAVSSSAGYLDWEIRTDPKTGATWRQATLKLPGMARAFAPDRGWSHNPGASALAGLDQRLLERATGASPRLTAGLWRAMVDRAEVAALVAADYRQWVQGLDLTQPKNERRHVGALDVEVLAALEARGLVPQSAVIDIADADLAHALRDVKPKGLPREVWEALPAYLGTPRAVLLQRQSRHEGGTLIYVFDSPEASGKFVVLVDFAGRAPLTEGRGALVVNRVRSGAWVHDLATLRDPRSYALLAGSL